MSLASLLGHTCTTQRAATTIDGYNNGKPIYADYLLTVPCRLIEDSERVVNSLTAESMVVTTYTLLVDGGCDILERDRVTDIVLSADETIAGPFVVRSVIARRRAATHHKSVSLERIA